MATLEVIQSKIAKLQKQAETMVAKQASAGLEKIRELMEKHGLTVADVEGFVGRKRGRRAGTAAAVKKAGAANQTKRVVPAKYLNAKTGETWSGRGRAPAWIKDVKDRSRFLIEAATESKSSAPNARSGTAAKKAVSKTPKAESKPVKSPRATVARKQGRSSSRVTAKKTRSRRPVVARKTTGKADAVVTPKVVTEAASE